MRPLRLRFAGLRSYRAEADINFVDLDLFAVIGDTGAGKSTIIEALCLALYGKKTWSGDSIKALIADGEDLVRVEFTFQSGDHKWLVRRSRRRTGNGQDLLQSTTNHVPDVHGHIAVTERIVELLGLTFEQFTRAVVMPQGRFDELLRSTPALRNQILKSLLGLEDLVRSAKAVTEVRDEVRPVHDRFIERRRNLPNDPQADLRAATATVDAARAQRATFEQTVTAVAGPLAVRRGVEQVQGPLAEALGLIGPAPAGAVADLTACLEAGERLLVELHEATAVAATAAASVTAATQEIDEARRGFATRDDLAMAASRLADAAADLPRHVTAVDEAEARRWALDEVTFPTEVNPVLVAAEQDTASTLAEARAALNRTLDARAAGAAAWTTLCAARMRVPVAIAEAEDAATAAEERGRAVDAAQVRLDLAVQACAEADAELEAVRLAQQVAAVAAGHGPGDSCPVCARNLPDGFIAPASSDLDAAGSAATAAQSTRQDIAGEVQELRGLAAAQLSTSQHRAGEADAARAAVEAAEAAAGDAGLDLAAAAEDDALASVAAATELASEKVRSAEEDKGEATLAVVTARAALEAQRDRHVERVSAADDEVRRARAALTRFLDLVGSLPEGWADDWHRTVEGLSPDGLGKLARQLGAAVESVDTATEARRGFEQAMAAAERRRDAVRADAAEQVTQPTQAVIGAVNRHLAEVRTVAARVVAAVASCGLTVEPPKEPLDDVLAQVTTAELSDAIALVAARLSAAADVVCVAEKVQVEVEVAGLEAAAAIEDALASAGCATVEEVHTRLGQSRSQVVQAEEEVSRAAAAVVEVAAIDEVLSIAGPFRENLEVLCAALGNNQFVDHLLDLREAELLAEASRRLKSLTGDRFGFVADFGVRNTSSGEVRSPDSLSGGERFQASLALALALVEIASRGAGRLDAVFVDEGFGSLDQNALETALATLGRVAGGGKTVALISHLRSVAEYVDTVMHVSRDDVFGSKIRTLTETERDQLLADDIRSGLTS